MAGKMRQEALRPKEPVKRKIGEKAVRTLSQQTRMMRIIFCEIRNGTLERSMGWTQIGVLEALRMATAASGYDKRIDAIEAALDNRLAMEAMAAKYYADDQDDDRAVLQ
jgi:hypothetical protein